MPSPVKQPIRPETSVIWRVECLDGALHYQLRKGWPYGRDA